ncbi:peroxidase family protein [Amaricoccus macauensis]|uniref:peroxidase family protein n=1 Tax=Amaricoccus macauensis TaxID=57001 RepID=UPI003C7D22DD
MKNGTRSANFRTRILAAIYTTIPRIPPLHRALNRYLINQLAFAVPPRPRPLTMKGGYSTWPGLTNRAYSGRHLPPAPSLNLPPLEDVLTLFERTKDLRAVDTTLLFPFFAQWFTDSFLRTKWKPEPDQDFAENESNHEIDLCQIYGLSEAQTDLLRAHEGGRLKSQTIDGAEWPVFLFEEGEDGPTMKPEFANLHSPVNFHRVFQNSTDEEKRHAFAVGLEHGNVTIGNTLMNTVFLREHNRVAGILSDAYPDWDDERVFQTTRNVCIVELLKIVIGEYIVHISPQPFPLFAEPGMAEKESWYRTNWIAVEFALLYRWHDLIPSTVEFAGQTESAGFLVRNNRRAIELGVERLSLDASRQRAGRIGLGNTDSILMDVQRVSMQMARRCQLAPYNDYRARYGMKPLATFEELTGEEVLAQRLKDLYGSMDRLEWFVGIFAEGYSNDDLMGGLLVRMVANDAFTQALTNPLLSKAVYGPDTFSEVGLRVIEATGSLGDVIARNSGVSAPTDVGFMITD